MGRSYFRGHRVSIIFLLKRYPHFNFPSVEPEGVRYSPTEEAEALNRLNYSWCVHVSLFKSDEWCDVHFRKLKEVCLIIRTRFSCPQRGVCERVRSKSWSFPISFQHLFIECTIKSGRHSYETVKLSQRRLNYYQAHWCHSFSFLCLNLKLPFLIVCLNFTRHGVYLRSLVVSHTSCRFSNKSVITLPSSILTFPFLFELICVVCSHGALSSPAVPAVLH